MRPENAAQIETLEKQDPDAARLLDLVTGLGAPFGLERSFKITQSNVLDGRFLLSLHRNALGADPLARLTDIAAQLNMPACHCEAVTANITDADIIHFGFEPGAAVTYKLYLEFATRFRDTIGKGRPAEPALVHIAFKWDPAGDGPGAVASYRCQPELTVAEIAGRLAAICGHHRNQTLCHIAGGFLDMAAARMNEQDIFFMEVAEDNNPRRSFDINFYDAELTLDAVTPLLADTWRHFDIEAERADALTSPLKRQPLGHLSGGTGRDGSEFLTIYFGVEPH
jgi:tryptophan halogenase